MYETFYFENVRESSKLGDLEVEGNVLLKRGVKNIRKRTMNYGTKEHRNTSSQTINLVQMKTQKFGDSDDQDGRKILLRHQLDSGGF